MLISEKLKKSILQAAIQGKLTEQLPSDGSAKTLLAKIKAEKQKLIAEGKIKKEKPLAPIPDDEKPFEIPENWEWAYIGDIFQHNTGKALNGSDKNGVQKKYITTSNLYWNKFELNNLRTMPFTETEIEKCTVVKGDILVCEGGDFGRTAIWQSDTPILIQNHIHRMRPFLEISREYFYYLFYFYKASNFVVGKGIGIQGLSSNALHSIIVPLPPLAEQKRIVARVEELFAEIEKLEKDEQKLDDLQKTFPSKLKNSLLQAAMQGKLTEQLPSDGNAKDLLAKIKKTSINDDDKLFNIPENWEWIKLCDVVNISTGKKDANYGTPNGHFLFFTCSKDVSKSPTYSYDGECLILPGNGANIGLVIYYKGKFEAYQRTYVLEKNNIVNVDMKYLQCALNWNWKKYNADKMYGSATPYIKLDNLEKYAFPLPPLAEQKRIVQKLEELLPLCEDLAK